MAKYITLDEQKVLQYYARKEIRQAMLAASHKKEVVGSFGGQGYAKRPDIIQYDSDILDQVKHGVTSFHASEELWQNPLNIGTQQSKEELNNLRIGWDLLLDIDCPILEYSQITAHLVVQLLRERFAIGCVSVKFSGNHGFHIAIPFEAFPPIMNNTPIQRLFPQAARMIASFITQILEKKVSEDILKYVMNTQKCNQQQAIIFISQQLEKKESDIVKNNTLDGFSVVGIDTILITSRHLYRQVYSINEKSGLVSLPINPEKILQFSKSMAQLETAPLSKFIFLDRSIVKPNEAFELLDQAFYCDAEKNRATTFLQMQQNLVKKQKAEFFSEQTEKIPFEFFPQEITLLMGPLQDGKKRALFILQNFLRSCGYSPPEIDVILRDWNKKHPEPLRDAYVEGQMRYFLQQNKIMLPPNFDTDIYRQILGDAQVQKVYRLKNPVAVAKIRYNIYLEDQKKQKKKIKKEEKKSPSVSKNSHSLKDEEKNDKEKNETTNVKETHSQTQKNQEQKEKRDQEQKETQKDS